MILHTAGKMALKLLLLYRLAAFLEHTNNITVLHKVCENQVGEQIAHGKKYSTMPSINFQKHNKFSGLIQELSNTVFKI